MSANDRWSHLNGSCESLGRIFVSGYLETPDDIRRVLTHVGFMPNRYVGLSSLCDAFGVLFLLPGQSVAGEVNTKDQ